MNAIMGKKNTNGHIGAANYDCTKCPAYCCSIYERVPVTKSDVGRLAKHFNVSFETATQRYTKLFGSERILRRKADPIFGEACKFINPETRQCTVYDARPKVCREFPEEPRCAYYDLLEFERRQQHDPGVVPVVKITFRNGHGQK